MDLRSAETALRRARKKLHHHMRMRLQAETPRSQARHERRVRSAQRQFGDAVWNVEALDLATD